MALRLGQYRIVAELGRGGMADVLLAFVNGPRGSGFSKLAVVKKLRPNLADDPDFIAMLIDEARITSRLAHPNVLQTHEVGEVDGTYFIAMEYLDGLPLHQIRRRAETSNVVIQDDLEYLVVADVLAGLHHAHELVDYDGAPLDVVHRDVTPHNVFITVDGLVKVVDFGIAQAAGRMGETSPGIVKGKFRYMAPEQALGHPLDRRVDIFAAGIILWEAATKRRFWSRREEREVFELLATGRYVASPRAVDPTIPSELDAIIVKALAHRREDRWQTAAAFREAIETFVGDRAFAARRAMGGLVRRLSAADRERIARIVERAGRREAEIEASLSETGDTHRPFVIPITEHPPVVDDTVRAPTIPIDVDAGSPHVPVVPIDARDPRVESFVRSLIRNVALAMIPIAALVSVGMSRGAAVVATSPLASETAGAQLDRSLRSHAPRANADEAPSASSLAPPRAPTVRAAPFVRAPVARPHTSSHASRDSARPHPQADGSGALHLDATDPWSIHAGSSK